MHSNQELDSILCSMISSIKSCDTKSKNELLTGYIENRLQESLESYNHDLMLSLDWIDRIDSIRAIQILERNT